MPQLSEYHDHKLVKALEANTVNNDGDGTGTLVDLAGYNSALLVIDVGASGDTLSGTVKHDFILKAGDLADGSDLAAVPAADVILAAGKVLGAGGIIETIDAPGKASAIVKAAYIGNHRYVKVLDDTTGTHTNGTPISAMWVLGHPRHSTTVG